MSASATRTNPPANHRAALGEDTIGPYYPYHFVDGDRSDLTLLHRGLNVRPQGQPIVLRGRLVDCEGQAVDDALLEFWQANAAGVWRTPDAATDPRLDPHFDGFGRLITTAHPFEFKTIKPGATAATPNAAARAPHITLTIFSDGITRLVTQVFFDDEALANAKDPVLASLSAELRERLIARSNPATAGASTIYDITIVMRGENETPFFDDLSS